MTPTSGRKSRCETGFFAFVKNFPKNACKTHNFVVL
nr:MAG TPA: hypothetical protein [Caudoviricetes sp.]